MENKPKKGRKPVDPKEKKQVVTVGIKTKTIDYFGSKREASKAMAAWAEAKAIHG